MYSNCEPSVTLEGSGEFTRCSLCDCRPDTCFWALCSCSVLCVDASPVPTSARPNPSHGSRATSNPLPRPHGGRSHLDKSLCFLKLSPDLRRPEKHNYLGAYSSPCATATCHAPRRGNGPGRPRALSPRPGRADSRSASRQSL